MHDIYCLSSDQPLIIVNTDIQSERLFTVTGLDEVKSFDRTDVSPRVLV